ncbi:MAG: MATE family efflux transporter [Planctomycetota bacterium]|nr:MATE family efflux transporter [Planctomycetota bacterium]
MRDTTKQPLVMAICALAGPAVLSFLLPNFYHVNDAYFLKQVGPEATNAMGLFQIVSIANFGFILTVARGTQSLVGRRYGAGDLAGCQAALAQGMRLALLVLIPLGVLEWIFIPSILEWMGGEGQTVVEGTTYIRSLLIFIPFLFASPLIEFCFQGMGDTKTPFKLQFMAVSTNLALNWLMVLPHEIVATAEGVRFDGFELSLGWLSSLVGDDVVAVGGYGVAGAAISTGISRLLSAFVGFRLLLRRDRLLSLGRRDSYRVNKPMRSEILRVGLPSGSSTFLYALVAAILTTLIARFGQNALGAYAIGFRGVESISFMVVLGFGVATGTVASHAVGAGDLPRARRAGHVGALLTSAVMLVPTAVFLLIPESLAGLYTDDVGIREKAATYIAIMAFCQVPQALEMVYSDAMIGAGSAVRAALVSIPGNILRLPIAFGLALGAGLGLRGVWYAVVISAALKGICMTVLFVRGGWEKGMHDTDGLSKA